MLSRDVKVVNYLPLMTHHFQLNKTVKINDVRYNCDIT